MLSVVVTAHAEGRLLRPTMRSVAAALQELVNNSVSCDLIITLDNPTEDTLREAAYWQDSAEISVPVQILRVAHGDVGSSRNSAAKIASGEYIAFCDGDDLVSKNYLINAIRLLSSLTSVAIAHPAQVVSFGARTLVWHVASSDVIDYLDLIRHNLWPSSSVSRRTVYLEFPYPATHPSEGWGPEDWLWNIETASAAIRHIPVPETVFFYRVRETGGVNNRHHRSLLPFFDLERLAAALPPVAHETHIASSGKFDARQHVRRIARESYRIARPMIRVVTRRLQQSTKEALFARAHRISRRFERPSPSLPASILTALRDATTLEPALSWTAAGFGRLPEWSPKNDEYATLLASLTRQLSGTSAALIAVPWVGVGGADLVSLNYANSLAETERFSRNVSILATYTPSHTLRHLIPGNVNFVQVPETFRALSPDLQRRLLAQLLTLVRPELVVSVNCFDITNSLQLYGSQLGSITRIFPTLFAFDRIGAGYPTNPITDDSRREFLDNVQGIITDNSVTADLIKTTLALDDSKVRIHHQPALSPIPELRISTRSYNNRFFSAANPFKLLWPHRIDVEKRPDSLVSIAMSLRKNEMPVEIHIYGQKVLSGAGPALMKELSAAGVKYDGPYQGGLVALPTHEFHAMLLTSESEGLPLVIVQSMLVGLPVIATAVGGVTDIIRDNETGLLVDGPDDTDGFITAIRRLLESVELRRELIHSAYDFAATQHGWSTFSRLVDELMD